MSFSSVFHQFPPVANGRLVISPPHAAVNGWKKPSVVRIGCPSIGYLGVFCLHIFSCKEVDTPYPIACPTSSRSTDYLWLFGDTAERLGLRHQEQLVQSLRSAADALHRHLIWQVPLRNISHRLSDVISRPLFQSQTAKLPPTRNVHLPRTHNSFDKEQKDG